jgi:transcriptional regulator with XRE-family HTH domain
MGARSTAYTFKSTFWNKKRVENNITIVELAKLFGVSRASMGAYLSGYLLPKDDIIKQMCEFFEVDPILGAREFRNAHNAWDAEKVKTLKASAGNRHKSQLNANEESEPTVPPVTVSEYKTITEDRAICSDILRATYKKVDYDEYEKLSDYLFNGTGDPLEVVYGKVDLKTFRTIEKALESRTEPIKDTSDSKWEI